MSLTDDSGSRILVVDDEVPFRKLLERNLTRAGFRVDGAASGEEAIERLAAATYEVVILDIQMPGVSGIELLSELKATANDTEAIVMTGHATIGSAIEAMKLGAYDYIEKPLKMSELGVLVEKACEKRRLRTENSRMKHELQRRQPPSEIIAKSAHMLETLRLIDTYAAADAPVLILGESGTGKELAARAIHLRGSRASGPFVPINCGALQETLLENELFGHVKGAFTGADADSPGLFEHADKGVLFIDEVCEMGVNVQKTFLRVLEDNRVRRLGDVREREVSVRIVAATNRDMEREVKEGRFREDLYYRLNVLRVDLPALRERPEDIPSLARHYLALFGRRTGQIRRITSEATRQLQRHAWPGNIRELFNVLERALIISTSGTIDVDDLPDFVAQAKHAGGDSAPGLAGTLDDLERRHIDRTLRAVAGNKTQAAKELGISVRSLYRKLEKYELR